MAAFSFSLVACQGMKGAAPEAERLQGIWRVTALANDSVSDINQAHIEFSDPPRLTGNAGCNRFFGLYEYRSGDLTVDETLGTSNIQCQPSVMAAEYRLLSFLPQSHRVHIDSEGRMELRDNRGRVLIKAQRELNP